MTSDPRIRLNAGKTFPRRPGTVKGETALDRTLATPEAVAGTPALAAIQSGLGAYLESRGFVAEHPLLYVDESNDPYVYVRFDVSWDGLGFLDTTFVYSPGAADLLNEIFDAYGVYEASEQARPYLAQTMLGDRPIHAAISSLTTCRRESEIDWCETYSKVRGRRPQRSWRQRMRTRCAAGQRRRRGDDFRKPMFDPLWEDDPRRRWRPPFSELPLNWTLSTLTEDEPENINWRADEDDEPAAAIASAATWRRYVKPRLIHASRDRGQGAFFETWLSSVKGGNGILGDEWEMYDLMYWSLKGVYEVKYYWESAEYDCFLLDTVGNLNHDFTFISQRLSSAVRAWLKSDTPINHKNMTTLLQQATQNEEIANAALIFKRQQAILAHRLHILPRSGWRRQIPQTYIFADQDAIDIIRRTLLELQ